MHIKPVSWLCVLELVGVILLSLAVEGPVVADRSLDVQGPGLFDRAMAVAGLGVADHSLAVEGPGDL